MIFSEMNKNWKINSSAFELTMNAFFEGDVTESEEPVQEEDNFVQLNGFQGLMMTMTVNGSI